MNNLSPVLNKTLFIKEQMVWPIVPVIKEAEARILFDFDRAIKAVKTKLKTFEEQSRKILSKVVEVLLELLKIGAVFLAAGALRVFVALVDFVMEDLAHQS